MLCDECHKNEAIITYTEVVGGVKRELHLCKECAARHTDKALEPLGESSFLANLLAGLFGLNPAGDELSDEDLQKTNLICPTCGMTYNEFLKNGRFGCQDCYKTFNFLIDGYFRKIHGGAQHTGKHPAYSGETVQIDSGHMKDEIDNYMKATADSRSDINITIDESSSEAELRAALKRAVSREEYEEAARIRDLIRAGHGGSSND